MTEKEYDQLRIGWDLLIDIDCKWFDFAKKAAEIIIKTFERLGIENVGIKFSGSKGFHIIVPWKAFPKEINGINTSDFFPELARNLIEYLREYSQKIFRDELSEDFESEFKNAEIKKGIKCKICDEIVSVYEQIELYCSFCKIGETRKIEKGSSEKTYKCPECNRELEQKVPKEIYECHKCNIDSLKEPKNFTQTEETDLFDLMGLDLILVSPRHLFRTPYSLHEKTALASVVLTKEELKNFELKDADPMKVKIRDFMPDSVEDEAKEFVMQTLDWIKNKEIKGSKKEKTTGKYAEFKPIKLKDLSDDDFSESIKKILKGLRDGKKRGLFVLINLFRSIGMEKQDLEKKIYDWNKRNEVPLKEGYIRAQLTWSYRRKPIMPPNFNSDYYKGIGIIPLREEIKLKNPVNYVIRKNLSKKKNKPKN